MAESPMVPESVEELHAQYDRLILSAIQRTNRQLTEEQIEDFRQIVYLRVLKYDFLAKCRAYYATNPGKFITSLYRLVRNVVFQGYRQAEYDPLTQAASIDEPPTAAARHGKRVVPGLLYKTRSHEHAIEARDILVQIGRRLASPKRRTQVADLLTAATEHGLHSGQLAHVLNANPSTIRVCLVAVRAEARRLEKPCPSSVTTKSARSSASRVPAGRSSSGKPTATVTPLA